MEADPTSCFISLPHTGPSELASSSLRRRIVWRNVTSDYFLSAQWAGTSSHWHLLACSLHRRPLLTCAIPSAALPLLSFLFCLLSAWSGGINPTVVLGVLCTLCPGHSWGWSSLGHLQWHGRLKQLLQNHQEKWGMGIPGFFCHKGGMRVVWSHVAEGNLDR